MKIKDIPCPKCNKFELDFKDLKPGCEVKCSSCGFYSKQKGFPAGAGDLVD